MAEVIREYPLLLADFVTVDINIGARILGIRSEGNRIFLYAVVDEQRTTEARTFCEYESYKTEPEIAGHYIGSCRIPSSPVSCHLFEIFATTFLSKSPATKLAMHRAGRTDGEWNNRFVKALDHLGYGLQPIKHGDPLPDGYLCPPVPYSEGEPFPYPSIVVRK